jgi:hypothetical protein
MGPERLRSVSGPASQDHGIQQRYAVAPAAALWERTGS